MDFHFVVYFSINIHFFIFYHKMQQKATFFTYLIYIVYKMHHNINFHCALKK